MTDDTERLPEVEENETAIAEFEDLVRQSRQKTAPLPQLQTEPLAGSSPTAKLLEEDGTLDNLVLRKRVEGRLTEDGAHRESGKALFGQWDKLDDKGKSDWIKGEQEYTQRSAGWWDSIHKNILAPRRRALEETGVNPDDDPFQGWAERKVREQVAFHKQRQQSAEHMEKGLKEGPKTGTARLIADTTGHGIVDGVVANVLKGLAYTGAAWESVHVDEFGAMPRIDATPMGKVQDKALYRLGQDVSDWAEARFPKDKARASEFKAQLGEGIGSLVGFMGPALGMKVAAFGMEKAGLSLLPSIIANPWVSVGVTSGGTGAMAQAGSMVDDAKKAFEGGKTVDGRPVDESDMLAAFLLSVPIGATEAAPLAHLFQGQKGQWIKRIFAQAYEEGGQEWVQQVAENFTARHFYDDKRQWDDNAWDGLLIGGLLGAKSQIIADTYRYATGKEQEGNEPPASKPVKEARARGQQRIVRDVEPTPAVEEPKEKEAPKEPYDVKQFYPEETKEEAGSGEGEAQAGGEVRSPDRAEQAGAGLPSAQAEGEVRVQGMVRKPPQEEAGQEQPERDVIGLDQPRSIVTPDGAMELQAVPELVELDDLRLASGALQPRDRSRAESEAGVRERAAGLDPERLLPSRVSDSGAPIVAEDGTIISGNGRVMSIAEVYRDPALKAQADAYKAALGPKAQGMRRPVLISRLGPMERADLERFADLSNRTAVAGMSATERAQRDARTAGPEIMGLYQGGSFTSPANAEFFRAFHNQAVSSAERGTISRNGVLTKEGEDRMAAAVLAAAYGDVELLARMLESTDDNIRSITGAMRDAAGAFVRLKETIRRGDGDAKFDITPQIAETARQIADLRNRNIKPAAFLAQQDAFTQLDPIVEQLIRAFYTDDLGRPLGRERLTEFLTNYAEEAAKHRGDGLIPDETLPQDVIAVAREKALRGDLLADRLKRAQGDLLAPSRAGAGGGPAAGAGREGQRSESDRGRQAAREPALEPWQQALADKITQLEAETQQRRAEFEQDVQANLAGYAADMEDFYVERGLSWDLSDQDVRAVAFYMAQGLTAEEALERYAAEEGHKALVERAARAQAQAGQATAGGQDAGQGAQGTGAASPGTTTAGQPAGARAAGAEAQGRGGAGARPAASGAAQQPGSAQPGVQQAQTGALGTSPRAGSPSPAELEYQSRLRARFRSLLAGKTSSKTWGQSLGVKPPEMKALVDEAVRDGLLLIDRRGVVRRTKIARATPRTTRPLTPEQRIAEPPDMRAARYIQMRESQTGRTVPPDVANFALDIEFARGRPGVFEGVLQVVKAAAVAGDLSVRDMQDLAFISGLREIKLRTGKRRVLSKYTKANALASIVQRHKDLLDFAAKQQARGRAVTELAALSSAGQTGQEQKRDFDKLGFYSALLEAAKNLKQEKGTPEQMLAMLRKSGVKEAEIKATKLDEFLAPQQSGDRTTSTKTRSRNLNQITRSEIVSYLEANRVEVREAVYGQGDRFIVEDREGNQIAEFATQREADEFIQQEAEAETIPQELYVNHQSNAKWSQYSLDPSNPTYRETVIHLPDPSRYEEIGKRLGEIVRRMGAIAKEGDRLDVLVVPGPGTKVDKTHPLAIEYQGLLDEQKALHDERNAIPRFTQGHFSNEPNAIAHARTSLQKDSSGKPVFLIDELQSDWGQKLREGGVRDEGKIAELEKRKDELEKEAHVLRQRAGDELGARLDDQWPVTTWLADLNSKLIGPAEELQQKIGTWANNWALVNAELRTAEAATPGHPLVSTTDQWTTTALRRLVRQAVEAGADAIAISPGQVQAERFNLANHVDWIKYEPETGRSAAGDAGFLTAGKAGQTLVQKPIKDRADLDAHIGKEMAERLLAQPLRGAPSSRRSHVLEDLGSVEIGGHGMRATYDAIYPRNLLKILRGLDPGIKQEEKALVSSLTDETFFEPNRGPATKGNLHRPILFHVFPLTSSVKASVLGGGQALFSIAGRGRAQQDAAMVEPQAEVVYHGGRNIGDEGVLQRGHYGRVGSGQDSGAIFLTPSRKYATQYVKTTDGALYEARLDLAKERIFDATNPEHLDELVKGYEQAFRDGDYDDIETARSDHSRVVAEIEASIRHGAADWATMVQFVDEIEKAGFTGAKFLERPGENINQLADGSFDVSGPPVYSYGMFKEVPVRKVADESGGFALFSIASQRSQASLEEREAAARARMETPEWKAAAEKPKADRDTSMQAGYLTPAWKAARKYAGGIVGFDAAVQTLVAQAEAEVPGGFAPAERKAYIVIGYPGAGKSTIAGALRETFLAAHIVSDNAKPLIPEYDNGANTGGVHQESGDLAEAASYALGRQGKNLILETLGTPVGVEVRAKALRGAGYSVSLIHVDMPTAIAMERAVARYDQDGRAVPLATYDTLKAGEVYANAKAQGVVDESAQIRWEEGSQGLTLGEASPGLQAIGDALQQPGGLVGRGGYRGVPQGMGAGQPAGQGRVNAPGGGFPLFALADAAPRHRPFTPQFQAALPTFASHLREQLERMVPPDVGVRVADRLFMQGIAADEIVHVVPNWPRHDFATNTAVLETKYLLEVALNSPSADRTPLGSGFHGVVHVLREKGLWSDQEWALLVERAKKTGIEKEMLVSTADKKDEHLIPIYRQLYEAQSRATGLIGEDLKARIDEMIDQELVAALAERFISGRAKYGSQIEALLDRIRQFFEALRNALRGMGFQTVDDVFERAYSGQVADRQYGRRPTFQPPTLSPQQIMLSSHEGRESLDSYGLMAIKAFHGSPNDWDAERHIRLADGTETYIGVDEPLPEGAEVIRDLPYGRPRFDKTRPGAHQAFGPGFYAAENPRVSETYWEAHERKASVSLDGEELSADPGSPKNKARIDAAQKALDDLGYDTHAHDELRRQAQRIDPDAKFNVPESQIARKYVRDRSHTKTFYPAAFQQPRGDSFNARWATSVRWRTLGDGTKELWFDDDRRRARHGDTGAGPLIINADGTIRKGSGRFLMDHGPLANLIGWPLAHRIISQKSGRIEQTIAFGAPNRHESRHQTPALAAAKLLENDGGVRDTAIDRQQKAIAENEKRLAGRSRLNPLPDARYAREHLALDIAHDQDVLQVLKDGTEEKGIPWDKLIADLEAFETKKAEHDRLSKEIRDVQYGRFDRNGDTRFQSSWLREDGWQELEGYRSLKAFEKQMDEAAELADDKDISDEELREGENSQYVSIEYAIAGAIRELRQLQAEGRLKWEKPPKSTVGGIYTLTLHYKPEELLQWDLPLSQQPKGVQEKLRKLYGSKVFKPTVRRAEVGDDGPAPHGLIPYLWWRARRAALGVSSYSVHTPATVADLVGGAKDQAALREELAKAGIPGIRFLDGFSRKKGEGSYNHVVFDTDKYVEVTHKNGTPVTAVEKKDVLASQQREEKQKLDAEYSRSGFDDQGFALMAIAGPKAKGAPLSSLRTAEAMQAKGKTPEQIWRSTGWAQLKDGKWRFEIDDSAAKLVDIEKHLRPKTVRTIVAPGFVGRMLGRKEKTITQTRRWAPKWAKGDVRYGRNIPLKDILHHPKLFEAYPFLAQMKVSMAIGQDVPKSLEGGSLAFMESKGRISWQPILVKARTQEDAMGTLLHEIDHYIQKKEGFAEGSAPSALSATPPPGVLPAGTKRNKGAKYSPDTKANQRGAGYESYWHRHPLSGLTQGERLALEVADLHSYIDGTMPAGERESFKLQHNIGWANQSAEDILVSKQLELQRILKVSALDYVDTLGERTAEITASRRTMTAEERRNTYPFGGLESAGVTRMVTPDFAAPADEVLRRAGISRAMQERWDTYTEVAPGVWVNRPDEDRLQFYPDPPATDAEDAGGRDEYFLEVRLYPAQASATLHLNATDYWNDLSEAEKNRLVDAAEKEVRSTYNARPVVEATAEMDDEEFAFWTKRDPFHGMFDLRNYRELLENMAVDQFGEGSKIAFFEGNDAVYIRTPEGEEKSLEGVNIAIPLPSLKVPDEYQGLDPEIWQEHLVARREAWRSAVASSEVKLLQGDAHFRQQQIEEMEKGREEEWGRYAVARDHIKNLIESTGKKGAPHRIGFMLDGFFASRPGAKTWRAAVADESIDPLHLRSENYRNDLRLITKWAKTPTNAALLDSAEKRLQKVNSIIDHQRDASREYGIAVKAVRDKVMELMDAADGGRVGAPAPRRADPFEQRPFDFAEAALKDGRDLLVRFETAFFGQNEAETFTSVEKISPDAVVAWLETYAVDPKVAGHPMQPALAEMAEHLKANLPKRGTTLASISGPAPTPRAFSLPLPGYEGSVIEKEKGSGDRIRTYKVTKSDGEDGSGIGSGSGDRGAITVLPGQALTPADTERFGDPVIAAIRLDGRVFTGRTHADAYTTAVGDLGQSRVDGIIAEAGPTTGTDGFLTSKGLYATREQATQLTWLQTPQGLARRYRALDAKDLPYPPAEQVRVTLTGNRLRAESEFGHMLGALDPATKTISDPTSRAEPQGQGHGVALYMAFADRAAEMGYTIKSANPVTYEAARVYESLKRRGYDVVRHPKAVEEGTTRRGTPLVVVVHGETIGNDAPFTIRPTRQSGDRGTSPLAAGASPEPNISSFIVSEQPNGSWELSFFNLKEAANAHAIIAAIESDIGNRLSPSGWLTPDSYEHWKKVSSDKVQFHQDAGPLFGGMWVSPKAIELATAVMQEASAQNRGALSLEDSSSLRKKLAHLQSLSSSLPEAQSLASIASWIGGPFEKVADWIKAKYYALGYPEEGKWPAGWPPEDWKASKIGVDPSIRPAGNPNFTASLAVAERRMQEAIKEQAGWRRGADDADARTDLSDIEKADFRRWVERKTAQLQQEIDRYAVYVAEERARQTWNMRGTSDPANDNRGGGPLPTPDFSVIEGGKGGGPTELASISGPGPATPGLDMSPEARKARLEAMGFDTSRTWYRGRALPVPPSFTLGRGGMHFGDDPDAIFFSSSPASASKYAEVHAYNNEMARIYAVRDATEGAYYRRPMTFLERWVMGRPIYKGETIEGDWMDGANVMPAYIRPGRQAVVDFQAMGGIAKFDIRKELKRLKAEGYDTVLVRNSNDAVGVDPKDPLPDEMVVFPKNGQYTNIRSINAAADPAQEGSPLLLASLSASRGGSHPVRMGQGASSSLDPLGASLSDLVEDLVEALDLTVRQGRLDPGLKARAGRAGAKVFGQFSPATGVTRLAIPQDFPTLTHEGGHALEARPSTRDPVAALKGTHAAEMTPGNPAPTAEELSEGWAEFFRLYLTDEKAAEAQYPTLFKDFEDMLDAHEPGMVLQLQAIQEGFQALLNASPAAAVRSRIQSTRRLGALGELRQELAEKGIKATISDKLYAYYHGYTDRWQGLKVATQYLLREGARMNGVALAEGEALTLKAINDPWKRARLAAQAKSQATATLLNGVKLRGTTEPTGPSYQDALAAAFGGKRRADWDEQKAEQFGSYLIARSILAEFDRFERGELEHAPDELISRDVWQKAKDDFEQANPNFVTGASMLYQFQKNMLKLMHAEGFITDEAYREYTTRVDYVPRNRVMPDRSPSSVGTPRGNNKRKVFFQFKGSNLDFINPLESIAQNVYAQQARITLNGVIRALDQVARWAGPAGGSVAERLPARELTAIRVDVRETMRAALRDVDPLGNWGLLELVDELFDENAAATIFRPTDINEKGERIVYLYEDGKRVPVRLGDDQIGKDIFEAFAAVGTENANIAFELATMGTQALRMGVTKAVSYVFNNFLRDQLQTWILSPDYTPYATGIKGLKHVIADDAPSKRAASFGVMMGGIDTQLQESAARERDISSLRRKGFFAVPLNWPRWAQPVEWSWKTFMRTMEITEAGTRVGHMEAIYQRALADGLTPEEAGWEAAYGANDVMPFDRHGSKMMTVARLVAFLNAAVQGMSAAFRTMSGERNIYSSYRDAVSPYLKAGLGMPVSVAEKQAMPNAARMWVKMITIGIIGAGIAALYAGDDDESAEHEEFNDYMRATHWFFKINGTWFRHPKPFELAVVSNALEAGFAAFWKQDPRALKQFAQSLRHTMVPPHELQAMKLYYEMATGKDTFRDKDIVGQDLRALAPEYQFNAYTSEFGRLIGRAFNWSPAMVDHFMAGALGTMGRDLLNASDWVLPRINMATGGVIPGVSKSPRADKSFEDYWFVSRFTRRAGRGALSTERFWKLAAHDSGEYSNAAATYKRLAAAGRADPTRSFEAKDFLGRLTDEQKAYAYLEGGWFREAYKDLHPIHRSRQVLQALSGIRKDMLMNSLVKQSTVPDARHKFREAELIKLTPSDQRVVNEILEDISMREARNALILVGHPGWKQKQILSTDGLIGELEKASPDVAAEVAYRLTKGRAKVLPFEAVREAWPQVRERLLKDGADADLSDLRAPYGSRSDIGVLRVPRKVKRSEPARDRYEPVPDARLPSFQLQ